MPKLRKKVEYLTLILSYELAKYFNVRDGRGEIRAGYVMHVYLPPNHPQFDQLISKIDPSVKKAAINSAAYGDTEPTNDEYFRFLESGRNTIKKQFPNIYSRMFGNSDDDE
jgi:hypothetical protein